MRRPSYFARISVLLTNLKSSHDKSKQKSLQKLIENWRKFTGRGTWRANTWRFVISHHNVQQNFVFMTDLNWGRRNTELTQALYCCNPERSKHPFEKLKVLFYFSCVCAFHLMRISCWDPKALARTAPHKSLNLQWKIIKIIHTYILYWSSLSGFFSINIKLYINHATYCKVKKSYMARDSCSRRVQWNI